MDKIMKEQALVLREQAKSQLLEIKTIDEAVTYINKVKAIETYCKAVKEDNEIVKIVAEQKIRSMRLAGQMLQQTEFDAGAKEKGWKNAVTSIDHVEKPKLLDFGLTKNESSTYQKIASIPDKDFEQEMDDAKQGDSTKDITVSRFKRASDNGYEKNDFIEQANNERQLKKYTKSLGFKITFINPNIIILTKKNKDLKKIKQLYN